MVALVCAALLAASGCAAVNESLLEKGESVDSGRRVFDEYFQEVAELRDEVEKLDSDLFPLRQPLTEAMELGVDTPLPKLLEETRKRVGKLRDYGVSLNLQLTPQATVLQEKGKLEQDPEDEGLALAIQESAVRGMATFRKYQELVERAASLDAKRGELANRIDSLPPGYEKRDLIETEIVAAGRVLRKAEDKLLRDTRTIAHFLVGLADVSDTGAATAQAKKCEDAMVAYEEKREKEEAKKRYRSRWSGRRPAPPKPVGPPAARPAPQPAPRPAPTRPAGGDFEM